MNPELLHILQHSLGVNEYGRGQQYRNSFMTGPGSKDWDFCCELVTMGLMRDNGSQILASGMHHFAVTDVGKTAMAMESPEPPKLTRSQRRMKAWREVSDLGCSFREFITNDYWKAARERWNC